MLTLCGQTFEPVWTDFGGGVTRTAEWRARVNEMGEIPVLEDGGERLTQTAAILLRLAERYGCFGPRSETERWEILRWLLWDNHKLTSYMATYRFLVTLQKSGETPVTEFLRTRMKTALGILDKHLTEQPTAVGGRLTIADI